MKNTLTRKFLAASAVGAFALGAAACSSDGTDDPTDDPIEDPVEDVGDGVDSVVDTVAE